MSYKIMKTEWYKLNIGNKKIIYRKTVDGLFLYLFEKEEKQCEVSDVLVLNKNGEIKYPADCWLKGSSEDGSETYMIKKGRLSLKLVPPYSISRKMQAKDISKMKEPS